MAGEPRAAGIEGGRQDGQVEAVVPGVEPVGTVPEDLELVEPVDPPQRPLQDVRAVAVATRAGDALGFSVHRKGTNTFTRMVM